MKEIVIFGAGRGGRHLLKEIQKRGTLKVIAFLDSHQNGNIDGIPIWKPLVFFVKCQTRIEYDYYITAGAQKSLKSMLDTLQENGIKNIYMLHDIAGKNAIPLWKGNGWDERWIRKVRFSEKKPTIHYFELPITDRCNLNCRGCIFGCSSIYIDNEHVPLEQVVKDIKRMSDLFFDVPWIRILGGEPLLHPHLKEILCVARKEFPDSEIDLCSNGLLIPSLNDEFMQLLLDLKVSLHISGYPPIEKMEDKVISRLQEYHIPYTFLSRPEFFRFYTQRPIHEMWRNYKDCPTSGCWEVYRGKMMRCSAAIAFNKLNKQFETNYEVTENKDWFSIHNSDMDAFKLKKALEHATHICKYCDIEHEQKFEWHNDGLPILSDYILE